MTANKTIQITTDGEKMYKITSQIKEALSTIIDDKNASGMLHIFTPHTSCALAISESYAPSAQMDVETFLKSLAPRNARYMQHTDEGEDDSPSHMKSIILNQTLSLMVENGEMVLGSWQGIFLAEFRDASHHRKLILKYVAD